MLPPSPPLPLLLLAYLFEFRRERDPSNVAPFCGSFKKLGHLSAVADTHSTSIYSCSKIDCKLATQYIYKTNEMILVQLMDGICHFHIEMSIRNKLLSCIFSLKLNVERMGEKQNGQVLNQRLLILCALVRSRFLSYKTKSRTNFGFSH